MPTTFTTIEGDEWVRKTTGGSPHLLRTLVQMDAPDHPKIPAADAVVVPARRTSATWRTASADRPGARGPDG